MRPSEEADARIVVVCGEDEEEEEEEEEGGRAMVSMSIAFTL